MVDVLGFSTHDDVGDRTVEILNGVPPQHAFWDEIEPFVARLRKLADEKLEARTRKKHEDELRLALGHLGEIGRDALTFHEALDVLGWLPEFFEVGAWAAAADACLDLYELLKRHSGLHQDQPSNRAAAKERRRELETLEDRIAERLEHLRGMLITPAREMPGAAAAADRRADASPDDRAGDPEHHAAIDADGDQYSVFTFGEERRLMAPRPGVCLVFASAATGLDSIESSMASMARRYGPVVEIPSVVQPANVAAWIRSNMPPGNETGGIVWQRLGRWSSELETGLPQMIDTQQRAGFRIMLVGGPAEGRSFVSMKDRDAVAARLEEVIACGRWQIAALEGRIRDAGLDTSTRSAADVLSATRGWHRLVEVMWTRKARQKGLDSMIAAFDSTFRSPGGYSGFRAALGLAAFPEAETVFRLMARRTYTPLAQDAVAKWIADKEPSLNVDVAAQAIAFLVMFQLLEADAAGRLVPDPLAREVVTSENA